MNRCNFRIPAVFAATLCLALITACSDNNSSDNAGRTDAKAAAAPAEKASPAAVADTGETGEGRITLRGELTYRQRIALPPGATATVRLQMRDAGGSTIITESTLSDIGQVPIAFSLTFPADALAADGDYLLDAVIRAPQGGELWALPEPKTVIPANAGDPMTLLLQQSPEPRGTND